MYNTIKIGQNDTKILPCFLRSTAIYLDYYDNPTPPMKGRCKMKQIDMQQLQNISLTFKSIYSINMVPRLKIFKTSSRRRNGFLYLVEGEVEYIFGQTVQKLHPGALIYLPFQSNHTYKGLTEKVRYIRLDFTALDYDSQETVIFSKFPLLITQKLDGKSEGILIELTTLCTKKNMFDQLKLNALLFEFLDRIIRITHEQTTPKSGNIAINVLNYISNHYTENITAESLCSTFHTSITYIRREFKRYTGFTITDYINHYRIRQSLPLLSQSNISILDVALEVGYNDVAYFCRIFKKIMFITPLQYRKSDL